VSYEVKPYDADGAVYGVVVTVPPLGIKGNTGETGLQAGQVWVDVADTYALRITPP
jgi:hypothetical protein